MPTPPPEWSSSPAQTAARVNAMGTYFEEHVLQGKTLVCASAASCRASTRHSFFEGQLHHIGVHYDLAWRGVPFRIMVVGQEYGNRPQHVSLLTRREMIAHESGRQRRFHAEPGYRPRNPHMRGTTTILRLLLGRSAGADHQGEYVALGRAPVHLFDAFALANVLLCSAVKTVGEGGALRGTAGSPSRHMRHRCQRHFRRTLEILEPTVLVVQGRVAGRSVQAAVDAVEPLDTPWPLARLQWGHSSGLAMFLSHPAAYGLKNWGQSARQTYIESTLVPSVREIQQRVGAGRQ